MKDTPQKTQENKNHIRCSKCNKLLAKHLPSECFEIKCARCGAIGVIFKKDI